MIFKISGQIIVKDASTEALKLMVKYFYTDHVNDDDITVDLVALAEKYDIFSLKKFCFNKLIEKINTDNCLQMYIFGYLYNYQQIKDISLEKFKEVRQKIENYPDLAQDLKDICERFPAIIVEIISSEL